MSWIAKIGRKIGGKIGRKIGRKVARRIARVARRCPPAWRLTHSVSETLDPDLASHLATCGRCSTQYQAQRTLAARLEAALPVPERMTHDAREAIAGRLRASSPAQAPQHHWRRWSWVGLAVVTLALTAALGGAITRVITSRLPPRRRPVALSDSRASIRAIGQARFARAQMPPNEIVRLYEGTIDLEVVPLNRAERFRVVTEDGEVEVRGTRFEVSASDHNLTAVHVWQGRVEVRSTSGAFAVLDAGDAWIRDSTAKATPSDTAKTAPSQSMAEPAHSLYSTPARPELSAGEVTAGASSRRSVKAHPLMTSSAKRDVPAPSDPTSAAAASGSQPASGVSFGHAWSLLRQGDAKGAAAEFAQVERIARGRDIEEDALYWRAVASGRAGDAAGSRLAFDAFLHRFPASSRAGKASASLGWLLLDSGDAHGARRAFERAAVDPSPNVRATAEEGLRRTQEEDR